MELMWRRLELSYLRVFFFKVHIWHAQIFFFFYNFTSFSVFQLYKTFMVDSTYIYHICIGGLERVKGYIK